MAGIAGVTRMTDFPEFWAKYPHKRGKIAAMKAWAKAVKISSAKEIIAGIELYIAHKPTWQDWAHPTTWLNQGRWMDEYETAGDSYGQTYGVSCRHCREPIGRVNTAGMHPKCYDEYVSGRTAQRLEGHVPMKDYLH